MIRSSIPDKYIKNTRPHQRDLWTQFNLRGVRRFEVMQGDFGQVNQDGPLEIFDIMCSREDVVVELLDMGANAVRARATGPWLRRREVALVELLQVANDLITEGDKQRTATAVDLVRQAIMEMPSALITPVVLPPNSAYRFDLRPLTLEATQDAEVFVWARAVQWRNL